ncbi:hypothetical protein TTHERM_00471130 (macronuclear) [Tetrahymena thermophila SB210]|uniref:Uncharacterized protein n=1 Tax=Tetrahymena thermophila (strain SB210) TaxID=312017 RepID=I7M6J8_TETTS|nr:hypothetical protein TTHERM_00471130 [Tetrahymena thermophila SB210]EAR85340.1 hypothetical protein TTHERM_00471130 [Tetrahymena thermophila SB210]|eukprot:XP_001033003.1 hypothetical protein TTHERM_00471130 [Tetrahymena thermophila SB210]
MINKQRNMIIKPLRVDNSNKLLNKVFPDGKKSQNLKSPMQNEEKKIVVEVEKKTFNPQHEDFSDDYDDTSSVSSCESDCREINIWDNSELRLRAINTEEFSDFYGKKLSFLQLYKIRSYFYTKGFRPHLGDIFKDAEKIHKFCRMQLNLDDFLEEEAKCNLIDIDIQKDKNFTRFSRFFEQQLELNSQKMRDEFYDRYSCVNFQACDSPEYQSYSPQKRNSTFVRTGQRMISGLNLSPRKPPKKRLFTEINQQMNPQEQIRKSQLNLLQLSEMQRKQKIQISQQRLMQDKLTEQGIQNNEETNKQNFLIADLEVQDNFASTSDSNYQKSNSSCGSQQDYSHKINNNPTNQINLRLTGSAAQSPVHSPNSIGSFKRSSPAANSQKSPNLSEQNEFRLKLCNTKDYDETQTNPTSNQNYGLEQRKISQFNQNSSNVNQQKGGNHKNDQLSSFTKFLSSSQSPKKRVIPNSVNASPAMKTSQKLNYDFNNFVRQSQNPVSNSISIKKSTNYNNQQQIPIQSEYQLGGKTNTINTSIKELKLPNIGVGLKDLKQSFKLSSESPIRNSQLYNQVFHNSASPNQNQISPIKSQSIQQHYQRTHKKFQSTIFGEETRKQFQQIISQKQ